LGRGRWTGGPSAVHRWCTGGGQGGVIAGIYDEAWLLEIEAIAAA